MAIYALLVKCIYLCVEKENYFRFAAVNRKYVVKFLILVYYCLISSR